MNLRLQHAVDREADHPGDPGCASRPLVQRGAEPPGFLRMAASRIVSAR
ncbi:hypothetical protein [Methylomagnum ishizawai]|nr:hypothetical protein [Methylomagnum ishizawai]